MDILAGDPEGVQQAQHCLAMAWLAEVIASHAPSQAQVLWQRAQQYLTMYFDHWFGEATACPKPF